MLLIHPKKGMEGKWEVAWMWLPAFMAMDQALIKEVDDSLNKEFAGSAVTDEESLFKVHLHTVDIIAKKYAIPGLRGYLNSITMVNFPGDQVP